jgi:glucosamine--fructose-6-phosphate aminotransferase (isomerizing)
VQPPVEFDPYMPEICAQPGALRRAAEALPEQVEVLREIGELIERRPRLVFTGMGSSHDACYPAVNELASRGLGALHVNAAELLHFRSRLLTDETLLVIVSQSGESAEAVHLADDLRARPSAPVIVSVTNGTTNGLAERAHLRLDTRAGVEVAPSSMTFAASLVQLAAVAKVSAGDDPSDACAEVGETAQLAAAGVEALLAAKDELAHRLAGVLGARAMIAAVGRGSARAAAEMGALTLQECGVVAEGFEAAAFRHGPVELAGPKLGAIIVATEPGTLPFELGLADDLVRAGAGVVVLSADGTAPEGAVVVELAPIDPSLSPAVSIVPIQLTAHRLAADAGRVPGGLTVASKVTTRE